MQLHNLLILAAFLLLALAMAYGLPIAIGGPVLLLLPVGGWQIWALSRIADGAKPNWSTFLWLSALLFGAVAYLLTIGFWMR